MLHIAREQCMAGKGDRPAAAVADPSVTTNCDRTGMLRGERCALISAKRQLADGERVDDAVSARQDRGNGRSGPSIVPETINWAEAAPAK